MTLRASPAICRLWTPSSPHVLGVARTDRDAWAMSVALDRAGRATPDERPSLDLYSARHARLVDDDATFPEQAIHEGDVLVLLVDDIEGHLLEFLDASRGTIRESLPTDLPIKGWRPYEEVLMAVEKRDHSGGIHIGQVVGDIGILAERIEGSVVQVNNAAVDDTLKELIRQLGDAETHGRRSRRW